jgi:hypothetical protein
VVKTVPERFIDLADLFEERNKEYGADYKSHGKMMISHLPDGINLVKEIDFSRYDIAVMIAAKYGRYMKNFHKGGHADSLRDIAVYCMMLAELDEEAK